MDGNHKILFFSETLCQGHGGIASYAHDFAYAYQGCDVEYVGADFCDDADLNAVHFDGDDYSVGNAFRLIDFINSSGADIVINSAFGLLSLVTPYLSDSIKVINVSHFVSGRYAYAAGLNAAYADAVITLSERNRIRYRKALADKTHVVYNRLADSVTPSDRPFPSCPIKIVFPGGSNRFKAADIVYKVLMRLLRTDLDFEFYWIGNTYLAGRRHVKGFITDIADALPADRRIRRVGRVERDEAKEIIGDADVFLLPSRAEGFPIALSEALSHRCIPIISDARHGSFDLVENGVSGIVVEQSDVEGYTNAIIDIITSPGKYAAMACRAMSDARERLSLEAWRGSMDAILGLPPNHKRRRQFDKCQYLLRRMSLAFNFRLDKSKRDYFLFKNFFSYPFTKKR